MTGLGGYKYNELRVGMSAVFSQTITEADIVLFAGVSGDNNAIHTNEEFAASTIFKGGVCPWHAVGQRDLSSNRRQLSGPGTIYMCQNLRFRAPRPGRRYRACDRHGRRDCSREHRVLLGTDCTQVGGQVVIEGEALVALPAS